jgi:hypothetical protein
MVSTDLYNSHNVFKFKLFSFLLKLITWKSLGNLHNYFFNRRGWDLLRLKTYLFFSPLRLLFYIFGQVFSTK